MLSEPTSSVLSLRVVSLSKSLPVAVSEFIQNNLSDWRHADSDWRRADVWSVMSSKLRGDSILLAAFPLSALSSHEPDCVEARRAFLRSPFQHTVAEVPPLSYGTRLPFRALVTSQLNTSRPKSVTIIGMTSPSLESTEFGGEMIPEIAAYLCSQTASAATPRGTAIVAGFALQSRIIPVCTVVNSRYADLSPEPYISNCPYLTNVRVLRVLAMPPGGAIGDVWLAEDSTGSYILKRSGGNSCRRGNDNMVGELITHELLERNRILSPRVEAVRVEGHDGFWLRRQPIEDLVARQRLTNWLPFRSSGNLNPIESELARLWAVDVLVGNLDRHEQNVCFGHSKDRASSLTRVVAFDHEMALLAPQDSSAYGAFSPTLVNPGQDDPIEYGSPTRVAFANRYYSNLLSWGRSDWRVRQQILWEAREVEETTSRLPIREIVSWLLSPAVAGALPEQRENLLIETLVTRNAQLVAAFERALERPT